MSHKTFEFINQGNESRRPYFFSVKILIIVAFELSSGFLHVVKAQSESLFFRTWLSVCIKE